MVNTSIVIGSTGLVGRLLISNLSNKDIDILAVTRKPIKNIAKNVKSFEIDFSSFLNDNTEYSPILISLEGEELYFQDINLEINKKINNNNSILFR